VTNDVFPATAPLKTREDDARGALVTDGRQTHSWKREFAVLLLVSTASFILHRVDHGDWRLGCSNSHNKATNSTITSIACFHTATSPLLATFMRTSLTITTRTANTRRLWVIVILMLAITSCRLCRAGAAAFTTRSRSAPLAFCSTSTTANRLQQQQPRQSHATHNIWGGSSRITILGYNSEVVPIQNRHGIRLFFSNNDDDDYDDDKNRSSSSGTTSTSLNNNRNDWVVPKFIDLPADQLEMSFVRSSGSGGQNVNKVNSQVQVRLHLPTAHFIPYEVRQRLSQSEAGRINKEGFLTLHVQEHRTQIQNKKTAMHKLQAMILQAWPRPKERNLRTGLSNGTKKRRKEDKRKRGEVKKNRGPVGFD
jgi:hypothetical protein